jgi:hypothetical protein
MTESFPTYRQIGTPRDRFGPPLSSSESSPCSLPRSRGDLRATVRTPMDRAAKRRFFCEIRSSEATRPPLVLLRQAAVADK